MSENQALVMESITKSFSGVRVLENVDLTLSRGEILGIVGENGAGKSTLIKIISGVYTKDSGTIVLNGKQVDIKNVDHAQQLGISVIYQELSLFLHLNAVENIFIHREETKGSSMLAAPLNNKAMKKVAGHILSEMLLTNVDLRKPLREMPLADRQMVEIARSLYAKPQIIIMDEPTAALGVKEREQLFAVIRKLKSDGHSIIFISHHLDEILEICDRVMILRDGHKVLDQRASTLTIDGMISQMIGKSVDVQYPKETVKIGAPLLEVKHLSKKGEFEDISFSLRQGEILGITGLAGCGNHRLLRTLYGISKYDKGNVSYKEKNIRIRNINDALRNKMVYLPAERKVESCFLQQSVLWNITIASLNKIQSKLALNKSEENRIVAGYVEQLNIKTSSPSEEIQYLSGGNQQKVILARLLMTMPDILLLDEPTRGIDVNAKTEVYKLIMECVKQGKSVILVSSEEAEVLAICDRIIVMHKGRISAHLAAKEANEEMIKKYSNTYGGI